MVTNYKSHVLSCCANKYVYKKTKLGVGMEQKNQISIRGDKMCFKF